MKNLKLRERFLALAMAGAMALMGSPAVEAEGLGDLLTSYGVEAPGYTTTTLDVTSWERGFVDSYLYCRDYVPSLADQNGVLLAAYYYFTNYNFTPVDLVPELAEKQYISENNCVDLGIIREDDPATAEDETMTEIIDQEGFVNFINANMCFNQINDAAERRMHSDWLILQENGGGHLNPEDYLDPSVLIQDPRQREIVHNWYVAFVEGYDLTPGSCSGNEKLQYVYRALGQLNGDRDEPDLNNLDPSVQFLVRSSLCNWFKNFTETYMWENYLEVIVNDLHYYDGRELADNQSFVKYLDAEPIEDRCTSELQELINDREYLHRVTTVDMPGDLFNMLDQVIVPKSDYDQIKAGVKTYKKK